MFYREAHRRMFRAILALNERGSVVDVLTLADELSLRGELEASGGKDYLAQLVDAVPTSANVEYHAKIIREKALVRRLIETSTEIITSAYEGKSTSHDLLDVAEQRIFQINQSRKTEGFHRIKELLWQAMEKIDPTLVDNPFIFPTDTDLENVAVFKPLTSSEQVKYDQAFQALIGN